MSETAFARGEPPAAIPEKDVGALPPSSPVPVIAGQFLDTAAGYLKAGNLTAGFDCLKWALRAAPTHPEVLSAYAAVAFLRRDFAEARNKFEHSAAIRPTAPVYVQLAQTCLELADVPAFEVALGKALELDENCPEALRLLGDLNALGGHYQAAVNVYCRALQRSPKDLTLNLLLAAVYYVGSEFVEAANVYRRILGLDPDNGLAKHYLSLMAESGSKQPPKTFRELFDEATSYVPQPKVSPQAPLSLGHTGDLAPKIPIFIISCNRLKCLQASIESYRQHIATPYEIVVHDNNSTYKPLLDYLAHLEQTGVAVYRSPVDVSVEEQLNTVANTVEHWFKTHSAPHYVVTDPDVALEVNCGDILELYAYLLDTVKDIEVVGPMLRIDDIPDFYPLKQKVVESHTRQFWHKTPLNVRWRNKNVQYQLAPIDTTFGMYRSGFKFHRLCHGYRIYAPYWARHLDWYIDPGAMSADQHYYLQHASVVSHWGGAWLRKNLMDQHNFCLK